MPPAATLNEFESWLETLLQRLAEDRLRAQERGDVVAAAAIARRIEAARSAHVEVKAFESECDLACWQGHASTKASDRRSA